MNFFLEIEWNILHNFGIEHFDQRPTEFKWKINSDLIFEFKVNLIEFVPK
jgi:hypothetical protein